MTNTLRIGDRVIFRRHVWSPVINVPANVTARVVAVDYLDDSHRPGSSLAHKPHFQLAIAAHDVGKCCLNNEDRADRGLWIGPYMDGTLADVEMFP